MKPAAIMASLVDVRNIAAHKCVRLEIHVPVEQAGLIMQAFGWPTAADPVPVAIARLNPEKAVSEAAKAEKPARKWDHISPAQQAGIRCAEKPFRVFLNETIAIEKLGLNEEEAAEAVRAFCRVMSRSEIGKTEHSSDAWHKLDTDYQLWLRGAQ